jgi:RNA polymerase sigma factor (sigma-70 family)
VDLFQKAYPVARRSARAHSAKWSRVFRAAGLDREDLEAACVAEVWSKLSRFNPMKASLPTFIEHIVASKSVTILRRCIARKRTQEPEAHRIDRIRLEVEIELRLGVRRALALLNDGDQKVARMLLHWNPSEIARMYGTTRAAVYRSMDRIRQALIGAGFENY